MHMMVCAVASDRDSAASPRHLSPAHPSSPPTPPPLLHCIASTPLSLYPSYTARWPEQRTLPCFPNPSPSCLRAGFFWAVLYVNSSNLLVPILIHALWNARIFVGSYLGV